MPVGTLLAPSMLGLATTTLNYHRNRMKRKEAYGLSRSRDKKGNIVKRSIVDYVLCIHTLVASGWSMEVLVVEVYEEDDNVL